MREAVRMEPKEAEAESRVCATCWWLEPCPCGKCGWGFCIRWDEHKPEDHSCDMWRRQ